MPAPGEVGAAFARPARWGLELRLFAILTLLGAAAVLVAGVLGYVQARDALQQAIYRQLTTAREIKARQVEAYFRTIHAELRLLATSKMVIDATRELRGAFVELDGQPLPGELPARVGDWYRAHFLPEIARVLGQEPVVADYLPSSAGANYLQYHYIVANPHAAARRRLVDDAGDGSRYSKLHGLYHPLLRAATATVGFEDLMIADTQTGRLIYTVDKAVDFATSTRVGPYRSTNVAAAVARCAVSGDQSAICLEDFALYPPAADAPTAFVAAPVIDAGTVIGVLIAKLSDDEIDRVVTGGRRWAHEGFGATGEAYLVGPDYLLRSAPRVFFEDRKRYFAELQAVGTPPSEIDAIRRFGSPVLLQHVDTMASRSAMTGLEGTGQVVGYRGVPTLASWGPLAIPGVKWALIAKIDVAEAFEPVYRLERDLLVVGGVTLIVMILIGGWLSRALLGPLHELTAGVRRFASGDYDAKVAVRTRDEIGQLCLAFNGMVDELRAKNAVIEGKSRENEELLLNVLPAPIANRLRGGEQRIADGFAEVTVAFADLVGFTALSSDMPPQEVVTLLNGLFTRFDQAAQELGIEKIKTVGDAYMAVCGLPEPVANHAERMVRMAIRMVHITREHALENRVDMQLRVGINSGPVVAGVIGKSKYIYDLWGDTVNLASRMESGGVANSIQVTRPVFEKLATLFSFESRGTIEVKGKGSVEAWLLRL